MGHGCGRDVELGTSDHDAVVTLVNDAEVQVGVVLLARRERSMPFGIGYARYAAKVSLPAMLDEGLDAHSVPGEGLRVRHPAGGRPERQKALEGHEQRRLPTQQGLHPRSQVVGRLRKLIGILAVQPALAVAVTGGHVRYRHPELRVLGHVPHELAVVEDPAAIRERGSILFRSHSDMPFVILGVTGPAYAAISVHVTGISAKPSIRFE